MNTVWIIASDFQAYSLKSPRSLGQEVVGSFLEKLLPGLALDILPATQRLC